MAQTALWGEEWGFWGLSPGDRSQDGPLSASSQGPLPVFCYMAGEKCPINFLLRGIDQCCHSSTLTLRGGAKPCSQQSIENPCSYPVFQPPGIPVLSSGSHPSLSIRIKNIQMAPAEVQLTWGEAWAAAWFESCQGDFLNSQG